MRSSVIDAIVGDAPRGKTLKAALSTKLMIPSKSSAKQGMNSRDIGGSMFPTKMAYTSAKLRAGKNGKYIDEPEIITRGFVYQYDSEELLDDLRREIDETVFRSDVSLKEDLEKSIKNFLHKETKNRPMVFVVLNEI